MPLDGGVIHCLANELQSAVGSHIEKIHIPSKNEFVMSLKGKSFSKRLFISINPDRPRINFTNVTFDNPDKPPMFCMLLRKHLSSGKITEIKTYGTERLIEIDVSSTNEMGDKIAPKLIVEMLGHSSNLILVGDDGKIIDSARRSDLEKAGRIIQPGMTYTLPEKTDKTDLLDGDLSSAVLRITSSGNTPLCKAIIDNIAGISPLVCREIAYKLGSIDIASENADIKKLNSVLERYKTEILGGAVPYILKDSKGNPKDFSFTEIIQYGSLYSVNTYDSFSVMLESFYCERDRLCRIERLSSDLLKLVKTLLARNEKKLALRKKELISTKDKEQFRIKGELIKANIYRIERGASSVTVQNYYDENCNDMIIKLNPALSPAANAAKYFKDYKKACSAEQTLGELIDSCKTECDYLDTVLFSLQSADNAATLSQIREELGQSGYLRVQKTNKKSKPSVVKPLEYNIDGFKILVGKNNIQNDILTLKTAEKNDLWFHVKNIHGSHVILFKEGRKPTENAVISAAKLAAYYSKAQRSSSVPVDYTPVKFVKKPSGAKPGKVIYTTNQTLFVTPEIP